MTEDFRTFYADPGEDFGWCIGHGLNLLSAGTTKMWDTAHNLWDALENPRDPSNPINSPDYLRDGQDPASLGLPIGRIVCEDFRIYPWAAASLAFDRVRTARVIGALTFMAQKFHIPFVLQGANIKPAAVAAGAEELYYKPLRENRHQNDAIQHFVFFTNTELLGLPLPIPEGTGPEAYE